MRQLIAVAAFALVLPGAAYAQAGPSASASASASAEIVEPLTIVCTSMKFGKIAPLLTASATVIMPAQGGPLGDPQNVVVPGSRSTATPSNCSVRGEFMLGYTVTLPTSGVLTSGANTMPLSSFTVSEETDPNPLDRQLSTADGALGFDGFGVGSTLTVGAAQAPGLYTGTFAVSVQYN